MSALLPLVVLSFGAGQDSATILALYLYDSDFRKSLDGFHLIVVQSDTGDEHPETYTYMEEVRALCAKHGIEYHVLTPDMGFHAPSWQSLPDAHERSIRLGHAMIVQMGVKTCTANLKISPIYKFVDEYINERYGYGFKVNKKTRGCNKDALKKYGKQFGRLTVLIGFAAGEEKRAAKSMKLQARDYGLPNEYGYWLSRRFPLIEKGMNRAACQKYLRSINVTCPIPSNCMRCPYMSKAELVWLSRKHPAKFAEWERWEKAKLDRFAGIEKNNGVLGSKKTLREMLAKAEETYGSWTDEQLDEYKFSHGHCIMSAY